MHSKYNLYTPRSSRNNKDDYTASADEGGIKRRSTPDCAADAHSDGCRRGTKRRCEYKEELERKRSRTDQYNNYPEVDANEFVGGPKIAVIGCGGGGNNALANLLEQTDLEHVKLIVANTDIQDLNKSKCANKIQLGPISTQGLGAGGDPRRGYLAAEESIEDIQNAIAGHHMIFCAFSAGGGTGSGAAQVVVDAAHDQNSLIICVTTTPFSFEGSRRMKVAKQCIADIEEQCDILVVVANDRVLSISNASTSMQDAFQAVDNVLAGFVSSITRIITKPGLVNIDFADVRSALYDMRARAMIGIGEAEGDNRGLNAAEQALSSPLLGDCSLKAARSVIVSVEGGKDMSLMDVNAAVERIQKEVSGDLEEDSDCRFFFGASFDDTLEGKIKVTLLAALNNPNKKSPSQHDLSNQLVEETYASKAPAEAVVANESHDTYSAVNDSGWWSRFAKNHKAPGSVSEISHSELYTQSTKKKP
jgi:cell division protein FtsZ